MASNENIKLVRKLYEFYNFNDLNKVNEVDEFFLPNVKLNDPAYPHAKSGLQAIKDAEIDYIKAFPNKVTTIDSIIAVDDQVVVRWTSEGDYKGPFHGFAPTNKQFEISGISIYRIENKKIAEIWQQWDRYGLLDQIGELKAAHAFY